uniref:Uncharacterized protein n=1 Tax=Octopus bimaculoides TaxID=37653 RepID=A0A0L8G315_OCTBM
MLSYFFLPSYSWSLSTTVHSTVNKWLFSTQHVSSTHITCSYQYRCLSCIIWPSNIS